MNWNNNFQKWTETIGFLERSSTIDLPQWTKTIIRPKRHYTTLHSLNGQISARTINNFYQFQRAYVQNDDLSSSFAMNES